MTEQRPIRASDRDRESVAEVLCDAYAAGCLDSGELEQRSGKAYSARTMDELRELTADLPGWLLDRPVACQYRFQPPPRRMAPGLPWGFGLALAGLCLIAVTVAWAPLAVSLVLVGLLVIAGTSSWLPLSSHHRSRPQRSDGRDP